MSTGRKKLSIWSNQGSMLLSGQTVPTLLTFIENELVDSQWT